jgi:putative transposase
MAKVNIYGALRKGFLYLVAIVDLFSRTMLSWELSNSLDTECRLEALEMALGGGRKPEVAHSDQDCQFTTSMFMARLQDQAIRISWSGKKRCYDNILRSETPAATGRTSPGFPQRARSILA